DSAPRTRRAVAGAIVEEALHLLAQPVDLVLALLAGGDREDADGAAAEVDEQRPGLPCFRGIEHAHGDAAELVQRRRARVAALAAEPGIGAADAVGDALARDLEQAAAPARDRLAADEVQRREQKAGRGPEGRVD